MYSSLAISKAQEKKLETAASDAESLMNEIEQTEEAWYEDHLIETNRSVILTVNQ